MITAPKAPASSSPIYPALQIVPIPLYWSTNNGKYCHD
jgi:hypothetical protein